MKNVVAFQKGTIIIPAAAEQNPQIAASLQAELMNLGFTLDKDAFTAACNAPQDWLASYAAEIIPHVRKQLGSDKIYRPFYRNFPAEVMEKSHLELFINAIVHYWSDGTWEPPQVLRDRGFAFENVKFNTIRLGTEADLKRLFTQFASSTQSLTQQDKDALKWLATTYGSQLPIPPVIPFKETLCILAACGLNVPLNTPTDVLRVAVYLSGGDISLPGVPKLKVTDIKAGMPHWYVEHLQKSQLEARENSNSKSSRALSAA